MSSTSRLPGTPYAPVVVAMSDRITDMYEYNSTTKVITGNLVWWRVWSNGFVEQGGVTRDYWDNNGPYVVESGPLLMPIAFASPNYCISLTASKNMTNAYSVEVLKRGKSWLLPSLAHDTGADPTCEISWRAEGWITDEALEAIMQGKHWQHNLVAGGDKYIDQGEWVY